MVVTFKEQHRMLGVHLKNAKEEATMKQRMLGEVATQHEDGTKTT